MTKVLFAQFWLFCGLWVGGIGALYFHFRLSKLVSLGVLERATKIAFVKGWLLAILMPCIVLWILQLTAGPAPGPEYCGWPAPQKWIALGVNIVVWIALLWWVWLASGAIVLSKLYPLVSQKGQRFPFGPTGFKVLSLLIVASGVLAIIQALT